MAILIAVLFVVLCLFCTRAVMAYLKRWERLHITSESILQSQLIVFGGLLWFALYDAIEHPDQELVMTPMADPSAYLALVTAMVKGLILGSGSLILLAGLMLLPFIFIHSRLQGLYDVERVKHPFYMYTTYLLFSNVVISLLFLAFMLIRQT